MNALKISKVHILQVPNASTQKSFQFSIQITGVVPALSLIPIIIIIPLCTVRRLLIYFLLVLAPNGRIFQPNPCKVQSLAKTFYLFFSLYFQTFGSKPPLPPIPGVQTHCCSRQDSGDTESVTEDPIVPQIIVPNQDYNDLDSVSSQFSVIEIIVKFIFSCISFRLWFVCVCEQYVISRMA